MPPVVAPSALGIRSRVSSWPDALDRALSWLLHHMPIAPALVASSDCSAPRRSARRSSRRPAEPLVWMSCWWMAHHAFSVSARDTRSCCRRRTSRRAGPRRSAARRGCSCTRLPMTPPPAAVICLAMLIQSSQVQDLSSGSFCLAFSSAALLTSIEKVLTPVGMAYCLPSIWPVASTCWSRSAVGTLPDRSARAPRPGVLAQAADLDADDVGGVVRRHLGGELLVVAGPVGEVALDARWSGSSPRTS